VADEAKVMADVATNEAHEALVGKSIQNSAEFVN
jgi:hypothetical protein